VPGKVLLNTTAIIALFQRDHAVIAALSEVEAAFVPSIALGELFYGAAKSEQAERNHARIEEFVRANTVLPVTAQTAEVYGRIKNQLRQRGRRIPENDIRIAAVAVQYDLDLAARDVHFGEVEGLRLLNW
jgi:tRNA(fMet)-specific endonuclease VapC